MGFWPPCTTPLIAAPETGCMSVPLRNWLVEHPVTRADTQQSKTLAAALIEVIAKNRFIIGHSWIAGIRSGPPNGPTSI
jgi:hypothetical protein